MVVLKLALTEAWDRCCEDRLCWDLCQALVETLHFWAEISGPSLAQFHDFHAWKGEKILLLALFTEQQWGVFGWCPNKRVLWFIKSPRFCPTIHGADVLNYTTKKVKKNNWGVLRVLGRENLTWVVPRPSNIGKWRFGSGSPTKNIKPVGLLPGSGTTQNLIDFNIPKILFQQTFGCFQKNNGVFPPKSSMI